MTIQGLIALAILCGVFLVYAGIGASILWHLFRFGISGDHSKIIATIFLIISMILMIGAYITYANIEWEALVQSLNFAI